MKLYLFWTVPLSIIRSLFAVHSAMVKFVNVKQAKETYQYRNNKEKLYKTYAAMWYNKISYPFVKFQYDIYHC